MERLRKEKPQLMLLQETKISRRKMEEILNKIEPKYECMTIDAKGSAGGMAILPCRNHNRLIDRHEKNTHGEVPINWK